MSTPEMLRTPDRPSQPSNRPDPLIGIVVGLLVLVVVGLLVAGTLAVYNWTTPAGEGPLVGAIAAVFGVAVLTLVVTAGIRAARRAR